LVLVAVAIISSTGFVMGRADNGSAVTAMRLFLWCWVCGMVVYTLYGIGGLPFMEGLGVWGAVLTGIAGGLLPLIAYAVRGRLIERLKY
jgi:hypothetical protein